MICIWHIYIQGYRDRGRCIQIHQEGYKGYVGRASGLEFRGFGLGSAVLFTGVQGSVQDLYV